jgi:DNA (cytosine-5)-methyltransferase 1
VGESTPYNEIMRNGDMDLVCHEAMRHTKKLKLRYSLIQSGVAPHDWPDEAKIVKRGTKELSTDKYTSNYRWLDPNRPSFTIPSSFYSSFIHPYEPRNLTAREAARLQSFPDHFEFKGKRTNMSASFLRAQGKQEYLTQYNQIGNEFDSNLIDNYLLIVVAQQIVQPNYQHT